MEQFSKDKPDKLRNSETYIEYQPTEVVKENEVRKEVLETELTENKELLQEKIEKEIKLIQSDPKLKDQAKEKGQYISRLTDDATVKIEQLFVLARDKGLFFAMAAARSMDDPYILDMFHDLLAKDGYYQEFIQKK